MGRGAVGGGLSYPETAARNSSIESAESVCSFALPRAPSATETRAIVASSGASTTFTKSNGPSVAH